MTRDNDQIAQLLARASGYYNSREHLALDEGRQRSAIIHLHGYGLLSVSALASVVGCSEWLVKKTIHGLPRPTGRGRLNPEHLPWLAYMLDGKARPTWVHNMIHEGTSLSTIHDITGISRSTLNRRK